MKLSSKYKLKNKLGLCANKGCFRHGIAELETRVYKGEKVVEAQSFCLCADCVAKSLSTFAK